MLSSRAMLWLLAGAVLLTNQVEAQGFFGRPLFGGFQQQATMMRFQNTACRGDSNESGTCLSHNDCERKGGTNSGACANGAGACCTFKVSLMPILAGRICVLSLGGTALPSLL